MSYNRNQTKELQKLAASLGYFQTMVNEDKEKINKQVEEALNSNEDPFAQLSIITNELVDVIAVISARIKVIEQAVAANSPIPNLDVTYSSDKPLIDRLMDSVVISASNLENSNNTYTLEQSDADLPYVWSGPSPDSYFELPVKRDKTKVFSLKFIGLADDSLLSDLVVMVDGQPIPHKIRFDGKCQVIECKVKKKTGASLTNVLVRLKRTISPASLGRADDARQLGLAIVSVEMH